jgi:phosphoribosylglycinamide formyltransferase-1
MKADHRTSAVPVLDSDTPEALAARILEQEHKIYPQAVQLFAEGRLKVNGRRYRSLARSPSATPSSAPPNRLRLVASC